MTGEFDIIAKYFSPLAAEANGAFGLADDAAALAAQNLVVTKDLLVEGVHFRAKDPRGAVAQKALRVNLSDLAAKGARPAGYFLGLVWPANVKEETIAEFSAGLREDQDAFKIALFGGDTTLHVQKGAPLTISVTMFGAQGSSGMIPRSGARSGDDVYVSGTIGDAGLGLASLSGDLRPSALDKSYLASRYLLPSPRVQLGGALGGAASAAIDVSDGVIADARHIAIQSCIAFELHAAKLPLSLAARRWLEGEADADAAITKLASFGDDYEILFTAPQARRRSVEMAAQVTKTPVTRIGSVSKGEGVALIGMAGRPLDLMSDGWDHFRRR